MVFILLTFCNIFAISCGFEETHETQSHLIDELELQLHDALKVIKQQTLEIDASNDRLLQNQATIRFLTESIKSKRQFAAAVGFTTSLSQTLTQLSAHQVIHFDHIVSNVGLGYNAGTGIFTCPVSGLYEFAVAIVSNGDHKNVDVDVMLEGTRILFVHATLFEFDTGTQVAITSCNKGQKVWVQVGVAGSKELRGGHCSFTGHLVNTY